MSNIDLATLGIAVDSTQVRKGAADLDGLTNAGVRAEKSVTGLTTASGVLSRALGAVAGVVGAIGIGRLITETATLSQRYHEMGVVLDTVGRNAGLLKTEVDAVTKSVKDQGISMIESRSVMTRMIQAQIDLSKATQLARLAQDAAVIGQINSSEALDRMIHGITSAQVEVLRGIGINVNFENSYKQLAKEIGVTVASLTEHQKMQARVNIVLAEASKLTGVYEASMENAGKQMRSTERLAEDLKVKIGGLFDETSRTAVRAYTDLLKDLDSTVEDMAKSGELKDWSHRIAIEFAGLIDITRVFIGQFKILGNLLATQFTNIKNGDFDKLSTTFANADKALMALYADGEKYQDQVNKRIIQESMLTDAVGRGAAVAQKKAEDEVKLAGGRKAEVDKLNKAQQESLRIGAEYVKLLEIERRQRQDMIAPYKESAKQASDRLNDMQDEIAAMKLVRDRQINLKEAVELTTIARLEEKKAKATDSLVIKEIDAEIAARRKVIGLMGQYDKLEEETRRTADQFSQLWVQAGRNIQTTLSNSVFDFFTGGLDDMVRNAKNAVLRIMSEFAGLKIAQSIGLGAMFAVPGTAAATGAVGGIGGTGAATAINAASLGTSALSLYKSGFGLPSLIGGGIKSVGSFFGSGSMAAFGGGFAGDALGGLAAGGFGSGAASAASMGASMGSAFAAAAGPLLVAFAATQGFKALAGDKRIGGGFGNALNTIGDIPIIGDLIPIIPILNGLFGRGPLKQKSTTLSGTLGTEGFTSGSLQTDFVAKGGLFRSDKNDFARVDAVTGEVSTDNRRLNDFANQLAKASRDIIGLIGDTTIQTSKHLKQIAGDLKLSTLGLESFNHEIKLVSEKGKGLTEEQISSEIEKITDSLAHSLIPEIDQLAKHGETAYQAVARLGQEFNALVNAGTNIGASLSGAREFILGASFDQRSEFVNAAGGIDALLQKTQFFADNFLSQSERLQPAQDLLNEELTKLGLSTDLTKDQFKQLIQSFGGVNGISQETMQALLNLAPAFITVRNAAEEAAKASELAAKAAEEAARAERERIRNGLMTSLGSAFSALQKSVDQERNQITERYNKKLEELNNRIQTISDSVSKLKSFSDSLKSTVNSLNPLSRELAKAQINTAIRTKKVDPDKLQFAIDSISNIPTSGFSSTFEFERERAKSANLLSNLGGVADKQLSEQQKMLDSLEKQKGILKSGFDEEIDKLDEMLEQGQMQIDALNGINSSVLSVGQAIARFNAAILRLGGQAVAGVDGRRTVAGNPKISDQQIRDFVNAPGRTAMGIYEAARDNGVSFRQFAKATGSNIKSLRNWARKNNLPVFADGGIHSGGLRIVGEQGPELEFTGPSRIVSNKDIVKTLNNDDVIAELRLLRKEIAKNTAYSNKVSKNIDAVTQGGTAFRTKQQA